MSPQGRDAGCPVRGEGRQEPAQIADVDVECLGRADPVLVPHVRHELVTAERRAGFPRHASEQVELLVPQLDACVPDRHAPTAEVDPQVTEFDDRGRGLRFRPAKVRADPGQEFCETDGFGQVVVGAGIQGAYYV